MGNDYFSGTPKPEPKPMPTKAPQKKHSALNWVVKNNSIMFIILLLLFASFILFVGSFTVGGGAVKRAFSVTTILLVCCSYLLHINGYITGTKSAERSDYVKGVNESYSYEITNIRKQKIEWQIEPFCAYYKQQELKNKKTEILLSAGFTETDIDIILSNKPFDDSLLTKEQKQAIKTAKGLKPIVLNKNMITSPSGDYDDRNPIISASKLATQKWLHFLIKLITTLASSAFVISITVDIITNFSLITVITALLQLVILLSSVFTGMTFGYKSEVKKAQRIQSIVNFIGEFWEWKERTPEEPNKSLIKVIEEPVQEVALPAPEPENIIEEHT